MQKCLFRLWRVVRRQCVYPKATLRNKNNRFKLLTIPSHPSSVISHQWDIF
ncbi:hypothetical protein [Dendronalium sp. ChiSLP03b]|uniref:hypothetical protein n=1 Tax=Dendronalium sp. ChiSLP03b TaxID=3075381 RepID=UPI002AD2E850|nr:hypothetical protein [Dendronalium sp. ChiSLP03b]MDZ8208965.1 hypothetical protein [Dendronalium sp. ChiSLP03b]